MNDLYSTVIKTLNAEPSLPPLPKYAAAITQLVQLLDQHQEWCDILDTYFPGAVTAEIETEAEYNDEGGYNNYILGLTARTADGTEVPFHYKGETDVDVLHDAFHDCKQEWSIPETGTFDRRRMLKLGYWSQDELRTAVDGLRQLVEQLPPSFFRA